jgi:VIT1/CCC1 family predicted Fe2+/Mn2+ transporter
MSDLIEEADSRARLLNPTERTSEVWFGLIMVLTFTCSLSVAEAGRADVREMLVSALGCNLAWGIIDGFMYLAASFSERGHAIEVLRALRAADTTERVHNIFEHAIPPTLYKVLTDEEIAGLTKRIKQLPEPPKHPSLTRDDWMGTLGVFALVVLSTLPVVLPFLFFTEPLRALRISNGIAIALLFVTGYKFGKYAGYGPWRMGMVVVVFAVALVGITIKLGG